MLQTIIIIIFYFFIDMLHTPTGSCTRNLTMRYKGRSCQLSQSSLAQNIKNYVTTSTAGTCFTETEMKYGTRLSKMLRVRNNSLRKRALLFSQVQHVVFQHYKEKERQNNRQNDATVSHTHTHTHKIAHVHVRLRAHRHRCTHAWLPNPMLSTSSIYIYVTKNFNGFLFVWISQVPFHSCE